MSQLLLIRHGQASFGADDYDRLSPVGERQARITGEYLARMGHKFDVVVSGGLSRQQKTAELAARAWTSPPKMVVDKTFTEYDASALFDAYLPRVLREHPALAEQSAQLGTDPRVFQHTLSRVGAHWIAGTPHDLDSCEAWDEFVTRVAGGLARLHDDYSRDARIAVFSSGGPIGAAVGASVGASADRTLQLSWDVYNASISELRSTRNGWRLVGFNNVSHLRGASGDDALVTLL